LGGYHSGSKHSSKDTLYRFAMPEASTFRIKNINHATYSWNFYSVDPNNSTEVFRESIHFDLRRAVDLYLSELRIKEKEMQNAIKDKNFSRKVIIETWHRFKKEMKHNRHSP
jgi:hypothetical protein